MRSKWEILSNAVDFYLQPTRRAIGLFYEASAAAGDMMLTKLKPPLGPCWRHPREVFNKDGHTDTTTWLAKLLTLHGLWSVRQTIDWLSSPIRRSSFPLMPFMGRWTDRSRARSLSLTEREAALACCLRDPLTLSVRDGEGTNRISALGLSRLESLARIISCCIS